MTHTHRFSIAVPTRNRAATLRYTLATCLDQRDFDDYEVVVNDNSDNHETELLVAALMAADPRAARKIKYSRRTDACSMSRNFEETISRTGGEYLIVLGDDDGIMPMALRELDRLITDTGAAVIHWRNGLYNWPDLTFQNAANYLGFRLERSFKVVDGRQALAEALDTLNYDRLPMLYLNTAVRRHVVDLMRDREGRLFRSRSPDVYSAMILAYRCGSYLDLSVPLSVAGLSDPSNKVSTGFGGDNPGPRLDFRTLNAKDGIVLHDHVPNLALFPIIDLADSFYQAKAEWFSQDDSLALPRRRLIQACIERTNNQATLVRQEIRRACEDDPNLLAFADQCLAENTPHAPRLRLRSEAHGAEGMKLHLDASDFGVSTIKGAVDLVHKTIWPKDAPLRYDLKDHSA